MRLNNLATLMQIVAQYLIFKLFDAGVKDFRFWVMLIVIELISFFSFCGGRYFEANKEER